MMKTKRGFTLAETLIALGVLGIIAAVTIPSLIQTTNKIQYVNGLKKSYELLKTANSQVAAKNGGSMYYAFTSGSSNAFRDAYCTYLNCIKKCDSGAGAGICHASNYKNLQGGAFIFTDFSTYSSVILNNGISIMFSSCNTNNFAPPCDIVIDINGLKAPNISGRDLFVLQMIHANPSRIQASFTFWSGLCDSSSVMPLNGVACANRVLVESKMNY